MMKVYAVKGEEPQTPPRLYVIFVHNFNTRHVSAFVGFYCILYMDFVLVRTINNFGLFYFMYERHTVALATVCTALKNKSI